jgi:hypothetical protein
MALPCNLFLEHTLILCCVGNVRTITATIIAPKDTEQVFRDELDIMFERRGPRFGNGSETRVTFEDSRHDKRYYLLLVATTSTGMKLGRDWLYDRGVRPGKLEQIAPTMVKKVRRSNPRSYSGFFFTVAENWVTYTDVAVICRFRMIC